MSLAGIRGWIYGLFGVIMLSTLWVTSLSTLSDRASATALLTEAGAHILNPFLVDRGLGLGQDTYAALEAQARAHAVRSPQPTAEIIDFSERTAQVVDQLYDQYADATVRAVGD